MTIFEPPACTWCFILFVAAAPSQSLNARYPTPPVQSNVLRDIWTKKQADAIQASNASTPALLSYLGRNSSRQALSKTCPELASRNESDILERILAEMAVSELVESFGGGQYEKIADLPKADFLYNLWEETFNFTKSAVCKGPENYNEIVLFGLPPFTVCPPKNWTEAANRLYYASLNFRKQPLGYAFYQAAFVFNRSYARDLVLVAPMDTGGWYGKGCRPTSVGVRNGVNCSAWKPLAVGTLDHMNHVIMARVGLETARKGFFPLLDCQSGVEAGVGGSRILGSGIGYEPHLPWEYFEANILGSVNYPDAVAYMLAPMLTLFGTAEGRALQAFCIKYGFPLLWMPCQGGGGYDRCWSGYQRATAIRMIDPVVLTSARANNVSRSVNVTPTDAFRQQFQSFWANSTTPLSGGTQAWVNLTRAALSSNASMLVRPLSAYDCAEPYGCIGMRVVAAPGNASAMAVDACVCHHWL